METQVGTNILTGEQRCHVNLLWFLAPTSVSAPLRPGCMWAFPYPSLSANLLSIWGTTQNWLTNIEQVTPNWTFGFMKYESQDQCLGVQAWWSGKVCSSPAPCYKPSIAKWLKTLQPTCCPYNHLPTLTWAKLFEEDQHEPSKNDTTIKYFPVPLTGWGWPPGPINKAYQSYGPCEKNNK